MLVRIAPDEIRKKGRVPTNGSLFFTIFQTFTSGPPKDGKPSPYFGAYPPDFFDFIIIDECHRGGANSEGEWRGILGYFAPAAPVADPRPRPRKIKVALADGKARAIQHMMCTTFWHPDGTPISAQQFMELLFGELPAFFQDEAELRQLWSTPSTRRQLLEGLAAKGFGRDQLIEMQRIIDAERSDLFDVLAYVAYALPPLTRGERAARGRVIIDSQFNPKQRSFIDFVLAHYVNGGVDELGQDKLSPLINLKYHSITDAVADLGEPDAIRQVFTGFQRFLYQDEPKGAAA